MEQGEVKINALGAEHSHTHTGWACKRLAPGALPSAQPAPRGHLPCVATVLSKFAVMDKAGCLSLQHVPSSTSFWSNLGISTIWIDIKGFKENEANFKTIFEPWLHFPSNFLLMCALGRQ